MSKSINIFGFHSIESILKTNPELVLKVLIQNGRKDKRIIDLSNTLDSHKISFSIADKSPLVSHRSDRPNPTHPDRKRRFCSISNTSEST